MRKENVLLIAGDSGVSRRVCHLLTDREIPVRLLDPLQDEVTAEAAFDVAFEMGATAVVLVEPLQRLGHHEPRASESLRAAALRAARSPHVTGFGWVTACDDNAAIADLRREGIPYGVLRTPALLEVSVDEALKVRAGKPVLVETQLAAGVERAGALPLEDAAEAVAAWIEQGGLREGGQRMVDATDQPVQRALRRLGFKPVVLARWRVDFNGRFGMARLSFDGQRWRIGHKPWTGVLPGPSALERGPQNVHGGLDNVF